MFPNPIPLSDGAATVNFDLRSTSDNKAVYVDASAPLDQSRTLTIAHTYTSKGKPEETRRSLYRIDQRVENAQGVQGTLSVYINVVIPTKVAASTDVTKGIALIASFLGETGYDQKMLKAEI